MTQGAEFYQVVFTSLWDGQSLSIAKELEMFIALNFGYDSRKGENRHRKRKGLLAGQNILKVGRKI